MVVVVVIGVIGVFASCGKRGGDHLQIAPVAAVVEGAIMPVQYCSILRYDSVVLFAARA